MVNRANPLHIYAPDLPDGFATLVKTGCCPAVLLRFEQWEKLGLDYVKHELVNDPRGVIGGSPQIRAWAAEWVKMKESAAAPDRNRVDQTGLAANVDHVGTNVSQSVKEGSNAPASSVPKAFLSYSWDSLKHRSWVQDLASRLRQEGVETIFDRWHLRPGHDKFLFMEQAIAGSDFVLIVCTPNYAEKANARDSGVGYEATIITPELAGKVTQTKFVPILRGGDWDNALPRWLKGRVGFDLRGPEYDEAHYQDLLDHLHGTAAAPPPIGPRRKSSTDQVLTEPVTLAPSETTKPPFVRKPNHSHGATSPKEPILHPIGLGALMLGNTRIQTVAIDNIQMATMNTARGAEVKLVLQHAGLEKRAEMNPGIWLPREDHADQVPAISADIPNEGRVHVAYLAENETNNYFFMWWHQSHIALGAPPEVGNWRALVSITAQNCKCLRFRIQFRITAECRLTDQQLLTEPVDFLAWLYFRDVEGQPYRNDLGLSLRAEQLLYDIATDCMIYRGSFDRPAIVMPRPGNPEPRTAGQIEMSVIEELLERNVVQILDSDYVLTETGQAYYDNFLRFPI